MIKRIIIGILAVTSLVASVGYFLYTTWDANKTLNSRSSEIKLSDIQISQNRDRLIKILTTNANVSMQDAMRGFWYRHIDEYGVEQVAFLDVNKLSEKDLTQWQIDNIGNVVAKATITGRDKMSVVALADMPGEYKFHNELYKTQKDGGFIVLKKELENRLKSGKYTKNDLFKLGYIYELEGKYNKRDELNKISCNKFNVRCDKSIEIVISGIVYDMDGMPVQGADVSIVSAPIAGVSVQTNVDGIYEIKLNVRKMEKVRVKANKRNYSDGIANTVVVTSGKHEYHMDDITLASPLKIVRIDTAKNTVTGKNNQYNNGVFIIKTPQSKYKIPSASIVHKDGASYTGEVDVYLYEFTRDTAPDSLLAVDTMDSVMGYAGDLMKSFGMPYIQFFTPDGEELHVLKSKPMNIEYKIYHMDRLRNNSDGIYTKLTEANMQKLVNDSTLLRGYPIGREYLIKKQMLQFPAFWVFDRGVGIWENVGVKVLTVDGLIESVFYTINDMR